MRLASDLTADEKLEILKEKFLTLRKRQHIDDQIKEEIINLLDDGTSVAKIACVIGRKRQTVYNWVNQFQKKNSEKNDVKTQNGQLSIFDNYVNGHDSVSNLTMDNELSKFDKPKIDTHLPKIDIVKSLPEGGKEKMDKFDSGEHCQFLPNSKMDNLEKILHFLYLSILYILQFFGLFFISSNEDLKGSSFSFKKLFCKLGKIFYSFFGDFILVGFTLFAIGMLIKLNSQLYKELGKDSQLALSMAFLFEGSLLILGFIKVDGCLRFLKYFCQGLVGFYVVVNLCSNIYIEFSALENQFDYWSNHQFVLNRDGKEFSMTEREMLLKEIVTTKLLISSLNQATVKYAGSFNQKNAEKSSLRAEELAVRLKKYNQEKEMKEEIPKQANKLKLFLFGQIVLVVISLLFPEILSKRVSQHLTYFRQGVRI